MNAIMANINSVPITIPAMGPADKCLPPSPPPPSTPSLFVGTDVLLILDIGGSVDSACNDVVLLIFVDVVAATVKEVGDMLLDDAAAVDALLVVVVNTGGVLFLAVGNTLIF